MPRHSRTAPATTSTRPRSPLTRRQLLGRSLGRGRDRLHGRPMPLARVLEAAEALGGRRAERAGARVGVPARRLRPARRRSSPAAQYGRYADLRRTLAMPDAAALRRRVALWPAPVAGRRARRRRRRAVRARARSASCPGIDYANPDLSHFHSRHFWETGLITAQDAPGWLGRWLDRHGSADNPLQGVSLDGGLSPVLRRRRAPVAAVSSPGDAQLWMSGTWGTRRRPGPWRPGRSWRRAGQRRGPGPVAAATRARG